MTPHFQGKLSRFSVSTRHLSWSRVVVVMATCLVLAEASDANPLGDGARNGVGNAERLEDGPPELGKVHFGATFAEVLLRAKRSDKPVFVLFDEVPGCSTVLGYGDEVLSHPLIVDAIETSFEPAFVQNNASSDHPHTKILRNYGEPAWNNPVGQIVDAAGRRLAPRLSGDYSLLETALYLRQGLVAAKQPVPEYLDLLVVEESAARRGSTQEAQFSMFCFWTGEVKLGAIDGVLATTPAHAGGREVVRVSFDSKRISYQRLLAEVKRTGAATSVIPLSSSQSTAASELGLQTLAASPLRVARRDEKYQLSTSALRFLPMTDLQRTKVNADVGQGKSGLHWLSPRQLALLADIATFMNINGFTGMRAHPPIRDFWKVRDQLKR